MNTRWTKVRADILANKLRSGLAIAAMAVGTTAVGATAFGASTVAASFESSFLHANPPSAVLRAEPFDDAIVAAATAHPAVGGAEGRRLQAVQATTPDGAAVGAELVAMTDFADNRIALIQPDTGDWPPAGEGIVLERASLAEFGAKIGEEILIQRPGEDPLALTVTGTAFDVYEVAPMLGGSLRGYVTMDTMVQLTGSAHLDTLFLRATEQPLDPDHAQTVAAAVRDQILAPADVAVTASITEEPSTHPAERSISFVVLAMQLLSVFALVIAVSLVVNTVTALLAQQRQQLGIMKAIGASVRQLTAMYLSYVVVLSVAALAVAVPLSLLLGRGIAAFLAGLANIELAGPGVPLQVVALQILLGTALPVAAVLIAVRRACRITVREAITDRGLTAEVRQPRVRIPVPRPLLLAYRNAVRSRGRLVLTLLTVAVCGGVLVGVSSTGTALGKLGEEVLGYSAYDVEVALSQSVPLGPAAAVLAGHPNVKAVEGWLRKDASLLHADGTEVNGISLTAAPADSASLLPTMLQGRWLTPGEDHPIVINTHFAEAEPDLGIGDQIVLRTDGHDQEWHIVGVSSTTLVGPVAYVPVEQLAASLGDRDGINTLAVSLSAGADQDEVAQQLRDRALDAGLPVALITTHQEAKAFVDGLFGIVVALLLLVGAILAVVAVIGVAGTMTLGVVEQTRELGVLRTLGASSWAVRRMLLLQGAATAIIGAFLGVALSLPVAALLRAAIGDSLISARLPFSFSWMGLAVWAVTAIVIGILGALQPARIAAKQTIRETLAYA